MTWSLVYSPPDEPITPALMFSLMSTETNCLVSGDLRSRDSYVTSFWSVWIDCALVLMQRYATFTVWMLHNSMETVWNQGIQLVSSQWPIGALIRRRLELASQQLSLLKSHLYGIVPYNSNNVYLIYSNSGDTSTSAKVLVIKLFYVKSQNTFAWNSTNSETNLVACHESFLTLYWSHLQIFNASNMAKFSIDNNLVFSWYASSHISLQYRQSCMPNVVC